MLKILREFSTCDDTLSDDGRESHAPRCSNGTLFEKLNPRAFDWCPIKNPGSFVYEWKILPNFLITLKKNLFLDISLHPTKCINKEDYWPCDCRRDGPLLCDRIPLATVRQMCHQKRGKISNQPSANKNVENLKLRIALNDWSLPTDLLADIIVRNKIEIECTVFNFNGEGFPFMDPCLGTASKFEKNRNSKNEEHSMPFRIDAASFQETRKFTREIDIRGCNLKGFDFRFLEGFHNLKILYFYSVINLHLAGWKTLPPLKNLNSLDILEGSNELNEWIEFPALSMGLINISFVGNNIGDKAIDTILQWALDSPSAETLKHLDLGRNSLSRIPRQLSSFKNLESLFLGFNQIKTIYSGSLQFLAHSVKKLWLNSMDIDKIEPGSFRGLIFN